MRRLSSVVLLGTFVVSTASASPHGEVVRVERRRGSFGVPRFCEMTGSTGDGICIGATEPGDRVTVFDLSQGGALGVFRIEKSEPSNDKWMCPRPDPTLFKVTGELLTGDPAKLQSVGRLYGVRGITIDPRMAKVVQNAAPPLGRAGEDVVAAIDLDGNGSADMIVVRFQCDEHGTLVSNGMPGICFDPFMDVGDHGIGQGMRRVNQDIIPVCM